MGFTQPIINLNKKIEDEYRRLNNGLKCPIIGLGTALIEKVEKDDKEKKEKEREIVYQSIIDGVRLIDTDQTSEEIVGKQIEKALNENIVKREDLFIVAKLEIEDKEDPEKALRKSLQRLKLDYVDLYLDRWPSCVCLNPEKNYKLIPIKNTWSLMERLVDLNLTKSIGVSNYNVENMFNILSDCRIKPAVLEVEFHPFLYQKELKEFCDLENIVIFAYNPLVSGEYVNRYYIYKSNLKIFDEAVFTLLKKKYQTLTIGQMILNWHLCLGVVPIPGTSKPERMKENLEARNFTIRNDYIELIGSNEKKEHRFNDGSNIFGVNIFA